jgi:hypothetical protein
MPDEPNDQAGIRSPTFDAVFSGRQNSLSRKAEAALGARTV